MGSGKWLFLAGIGTGAFLVLRLPQRQIESIKDFTSQIAQSPNLTAAKAAASEKLRAALRHHGSILVDRMAEELKRQLHAVDLNRESAESEDTSTTSNGDGQSNTEKDGHIIIDGKIVS